MTDTPLKPCPFCGGINVKTFGPYGWYSQWVITHSCRTFYSGSAEMARGFHSETEAIAAWNTRAYPTVSAPEPAAWKYKHKSGLVYVFEDRRLQNGGNDWTETPLYTAMRNAAPKENVT